MNTLGALRGYLEQHHPKATQGELRCTCGAGNHVRVIFFRVNGQPASVLLPEGAWLSAQELQDALGGPREIWRVEPIPPAEMNFIFADTELGHGQPFDSPFGARVFLDETLLDCEELVFCPRMFFGQPAECFRTTTGEFVKLLHPVVLPLVAVHMGTGNEWAV